jgi:hypothetical protein
LRIFRWLIGLSLIVSIAYSGRELLTVARLAKGIGNPAAAPDAQAAPAPPPAFPGPDHAEAADTNSAPGKIFAAKGGTNKAALSGGAVIVDANGNRLELVPASRPKPNVARVALKNSSKLELPTLDDPRAGLQARKLRAEVALGACAVAAVVLAFWARKYRLG